MYVCIKIRKIHTTITILISATDPIVVAGIYNYFLPTNSNFNLQGSGPLAVLFKLYFHTGFNHKT